MDEPKEEILYSCVGSVDGCKAELRGPPFRAKELLNERGWVFAEAEVCDPFGGRMFDTSGYACPACVVAGKAKPIPPPKPPPPPCEKCGDSGVVAGRLCSCLYGDQEQALPKMLEVVKAARALSGAIDPYGGMGWTVPRPDQGLVFKLQEALAALGKGKER